MEAVRHSQTLDRMFHALADASRRGMVDRLAGGPASVTELARPLAMALPSVLKHLTVLEGAGIVLSDKAGRVRTYRMVPGALGTIEAWVAARKARLHSDFDRLAHYLAEQAGPAGGTEEQ